ncbi:hypothetical protein N7471_003093 [Penicillium samsonianum]|uniref:uncharacterized protein n=1 Tax=Penicillium samsonianum TaxID=1882272 RepID=UPI0025466184|nr:uncharacterized protein N7471_003093 [Penicillium samsonianum]KAJ6143640.1 hypothetical protein N7471_003093 [Penicillium samsonianum]
MTSVQAYYEQTEVSNWLDAISGDNGSIDPRTLEVHQVVTTHRNTHHNTHRHDQTSRSEQQPSPQSSRPSSPDLRSLGPLKLEHEPPIRRVLTKASLRQLYDRINQYDRRRTFTEFRNEEDDSVSLATTATDSEYENCFLPFCGALPSPSEEYSAASSASSSPSPSPPTNHEPQWLPLLVARVVSSKTRKAYRALKKKLSQ